MFEHAETLLATVIAQLYVSQFGYDFGQQFYSISQFVCTTCIRIMIVARGGEALHILNIES